MLSITTTMNIGWTNYMLILLMTPMLAYFLMLLTVVILASIGVDVRDLDTANLFVIYIQILTILIVLRWLKRKVYTDE
jgi:hypothetical protein